MSGLIGGLAADALSARYDVHGIGRTPVEGHPYTVADISRFEEMRPAFEGVDVVIHMAASRGNQPFETHYQANITGTYNVLEAARQAGVRRVIMASSGAVIAGYEQDEPYRSMTGGDPDYTPPQPVPLITTAHPVRPRSFYCVTKLWTEALGQVYAEAHGMSVVCIRVSKVEVSDRPANPRNAAVWCSHRDIVQLIEKCVDAPDSVRFEVVFGVSDGPMNYRDWSRPHEVFGYTPQDNAGQFSFS